jgi:transposase
MKKQVFKKYDQPMETLFPSLDINQLIPQNHLARVVDKVINGIDLRLMEKCYKGGGSSAYHPLMMLKVIIYAYSTKLFSCRKIEQALTQDITYMWLSGMQTPNYGTINNYRTIIFKDILETVFRQVLDYLHENGYVKYETYFVDGTKINADANKYSYVWRKNTDRYMAGVQEKIKGLFQEIDRINQQEDKEYGNQGIKEALEMGQMDSVKIKEAAQKINQGLKDEEEKKAKEYKKKLKAITKEVEKLEKYEQQKEILGERNSYSKTDNDATFMRDKEDQLRPEYNIQMSSESQFITNFSVSQNASDTATFNDHFEKLGKAGEKYLPENYGGDQAYGSEENYSTLVKNRIVNYFKFNTFHIEQTDKYKNDPFKKDNMPYDTQTDSFTCPNNKKLVFEKEDVQYSASGYKSNIRIYKSEGCQDCEHKAKCTKGKGDRTIQMNPKLEEYKTQARANLNSEKGIQLRKQRGIDIETVWADIKHNLGYRRFKLRGKEKVELEVGWLSLAHNFRKLYLKTVKKAA